MYEEFCPGTAWRDEVSFRNIWSPVVHYLYIILNIGLALNWADNINSYYLGSYWTVAYVAYEWTFSIGICNIRTVSDELRKIISHYILLGLLNIDRNVFYEMSQGLEHDTLLLNTPTPMKFQFLLLSHLNESTPAAPVRRWRCHSWNIAAYFFTC